MGERIKKLFENSQDKFLSVYFTAGHPTIDSVGVIIEELSKGGVGFIEIGIPFSDPVADGPIIQHSSDTALKNGMNINLLMEILHKVRSSSDVPLILMGYINPILRFGIERFCRIASEIGIDGVIIPDLPYEEYLRSYANLIADYKLDFIFLVSPNTDEDRIRAIDAASTGFLYAISSTATTGKKAEMTAEIHEYLKRLSEMKLRNPLVVGFGIHDKLSFRAFTEFARGGIVGSAFINYIDRCKETNSLREKIPQFLSSIKP